MNQKIKTICLVLITFAILVGIGFYIWATFQEQKGNYSACAAWCNFYSSTEGSLDKCLESCRIDSNFFKFIR